VILIAGCLFSSLANSLAPRHGGKNINLLRFVDYENEGQLTRHREKLRHSYVFD
jgi:hypothetical protein